MTAAELARRIHIDPARVLSLLEGLEGLGYVDFNGQREIAARPRLAGDRRL